MNPEEIHLSKISADLILEERGMTREWVENATAHIPRSAPIRSQNLLTRNAPPSDKKTVPRENYHTTETSQNLRYSIIEIAKTKGIPLSKVGRELGLSESTIERFTSGRIKNPFHSTVLRIKDWIDKNQTEKK